MKNFSFGVYNTHFQLGDNGSGLSSPQATVVFSAEPAATGITLLPGASVTLEETTFTGNRVAIQVLNTDTLISNCHIADSYYYGIKEETEGTPQLSGNTFTGNNIAYYDKNETSLTQGELNNRNGNSGNTITE